MRFVFSLVLVLCSLAAVSAQPAFIKVPLLHNRCNEKSLLADIVNRCSRPELGNSRGTDAHETTHQLNSQIRNAQGTRCNAFYILGGKAVVCKEPAVTISQVCRFVPQSLRSYRFQLYCIQQQQHWNNEPLYLVDEWSAYINGCAVALEDAQVKRNHSNADEASGVIELGIYSIAMAMAVEKNDPEYFARDPQFKPFMKYQWARAKKIFDQAAPLFPSVNQTRQLQALQSSTEAADMRAFIARHLDGVWLEK